MKAAIDRVLTDPVESGKIPGVVALVADGSGLVYQGAFGRRAIDRPEPMTLDSVFRIASMTKAITATAAMQLVESGRIGLDQPIGELLPFTRDVQVLEGFDEADKPRLRAPASQVTVRHLLTHTSGYGYDIFNADLARYIAAAGLPSIVTCRHDSLKYRCCSIPARGGNTASASTWWAGSSKPSAARILRRISASTSSVRSAWPTPASVRAMRWGRVWSARMRGGRRQPGAARV